jgi:hypothetical protein
MRKLLGKQFELSLENNHAAPWCVLDVGLVVILANNFNNYHR